MKRVENTHLPVAALTHPGMKGKNNEDRFGVAAFRMTTQAATPVLLAVLSDGIGGHRAGEVASELAVNAISQYVADSDGRNPPRILEEAIQYASQLIFQQAQMNVEQQGMGATCACAWIAGDRLFTATVGDSRIYLMRDEGIQQLSTDHTWIQEALERGLIEPGEVNGHPNAHVIRRYLGSPTPPEVDFRLRVNGREESEEQMLNNQGLRLAPSDLLLLCSDGLTDLVNDEEIRETFERLSLEEAGQQLISMANARGGHDNITLVAVQIPGPNLKPAAAPAAASPTEETVQVVVGTKTGEKKAAPATRKKTRASSVSRPLLTGCLGVIALAILVGGLAGGYLLYFDTDQPTPTPTPGQQTTTEPAPSGPTRNATRTRRPTLTPSPFAPASSTPTRTPTLRPGAVATLTPWPTSTRTPVGNQPLPVVTVNP